MTDANYIEWVQRALNLALPEDVRIDGADTKLYRDRVCLFNDIYLHNVRPPGNDKVDEPLQNALIRCNHANAPFRRWACIAMGDPKPLTGAAFRKAIQTFQSQQKVSPADGWVGRNTENRLLMYARTPHPGHIGNGPAKPPMPSPEIPEDDADDDIVAHALNRMIPVQRIAAMASRARGFYRGIGTFERQEKLCDVLCLIRPYEVVARPRWYFIADDIANISRSYDPIWRNYNAVLAEKGREWILRHMQHTNFMTDGNYHLTNAVNGNWTSSRQLQDADKRFRSAINHIARSIESGFYRMSLEINLVGSVRPEDSTFYTIVPERMEILSRIPDNLYYAYHMPVPGWWDRIAGMDWPTQ